MSHGYRLVWGFLDSRQGSQDFFSKQAALSYASDVLRPTQRWELWELPAPRLKKTGHGMRRDEP